MSLTLRHALAVTACLVLTGAIVALFWYQDWQYSRPTPRPDGYVTVAAGTPLALPARVNALRRPGRPLLLHFFNPSCPCSRFNLDHVRALVSRFGDAVTFAAVLQGDRDEVLADAYEALGLDIPYVLDDGAAARATGAYSTPQAAIVDADGRLFYRGNYNVTRYCRDRDTEFARLALEALVDGRPAPSVNAAADTAYGCPLPARQARAVTAPELPD